MDHPESPTSNDRCPPSSVWEEFLGYISGQRIEKCQEPLPIAVCSFYSSSLYCGRPVGPVGKHPLALSLLFGFHLTCLLPKFMPLAACGFPKCELEKILEQWVRLMPYICLLSSLWGWIFTLRAHSQAPMASPNRRRTSWNIQATLNYIFRIHFQILPAHPGQLSAISLFTVSLPSNEFSFVGNHRGDSPDSP